ncbi:MAG: CCC motif membrane protein [Bacteroidales bacterium]|nr:CCC motif membrane protein [Bacteroidales bacterium]
MENQTQLRQEPVPNSTAILVLGIISIALCWCYGIIGLTLGIIALVLSGKANAAYKADPDKYTIGSFKNAKAGRICAIIGLSLSAIYLIIIIIYFVILGAALTMVPWEMMNY